MAARRLRDFAEGHMSPKPKKKPHTGETGLSGTVAPRVMVGVSSGWRLKLIGF